MKYSLILFTFPILLITILAIAIHPLMTNILHPFLPAVASICKIVFVFLVFAYCIALTKVSRFTRTSILICIFFVSLILVSSIQVVVNDIHGSPSFVIAICLLALIVSFYNVTGTNLSLSISRKTWYEILASLKVACSILAIFLLLSLALEIVVKYFPNFIELKMLLRENGNIIFPFRLTGFQRDANRWAFCIFVLLFVLHYLPLKNSFILKLISSVLCIYLITTLSKTAFFVILLLGIINAFIYFQKTTLKIGAYGVALIVIVAGSFPFYEDLYEGTGLQRRIDFTVESILNPAEARTLNEREETYVAALTGIEKKPVLGHGYINFTVDTSDQYSITVHNSFLSLASYFGLPLGVLAYILLFAIPFVYLIVKCGFELAQFNLFIVVLIYSNLVSFAHDLTSLLILYLGLLVCAVTRKVKIHET